MTDAPTPQPIARPTWRTALVVVVCTTVFVFGCSSGGDDGDDGDDAFSPPTDTAVEEHETSAPDDGATLVESAGSEGTDPLAPLPDDVALPIVFVHGFAGSAQQYESQSMRFVANGFPQERIVAYDHDGAGFDIPGYVGGLSEVVDETLAAFDVEQVYLVGHSRGTAVSSAYLDDPERAAKVAKYVAIDGAPCPDVVPCVAPTQGELPGQSHVEVATSAESFVMQYEFLIGEEPAVVDIVPQRAPVEISGRAVEFPANTGRDALLEIWAVDSDTGARLDDEPHATIDLGPAGEFGPIEVESGAHYEYALTSETSQVTHHLYLQPYVRSSHLVRLLSSPPDGTTRANTNTGDAHTALIIMRMREWHAEGDSRDVLEIGIDGQEPVDVIVDFVGNGAIGLHIHDDSATPGETTLAPLPYFSEQPFQNGIDVFLSATPDGNGTVTITNLPRGDADRPQTINVPRWRSSEHSVSVVFGDWAVDQASTDP